MNADFSYFEGLYGKLGGLRYLISSKLSEEEGQTLENGEKLLEELTKCRHPKHNESPRTCVCLDPTCSQKGLICYLCLMESHKMHAMKVFKIEEVYEFLQQNSEALMEIEEDQGKSLNEVLEEGKLSRSLEDFNTDLQEQIVMFLSEMRIQNTNKAKAFHSISDVDDAQSIISQRINRISSLIRYSEDSSFKGFIELSEAKANLVQKMDFLRDYLQKEIEAFKEKMKAVIHVTLKTDMEMSLEKYKEKPLEVKIEKQKGEEVFEEEKISPSRPLLIGSTKKSLSLQQNVIKRLPHLPPRTESYWPVRAEKKERIKFRPLRDRVALLGFTQLKIMHFDGEVAKFKISLSESSAEEANQEAKISLVKRRKSLTLYSQEMQITPDENEESNFMLFDKGISLKDDCEYVLELSVLEKYGFACKFGINNQGIPPENDVLEFLPAQDEIDEKISPTSNRSFGFRTSLTEGLFPSLIYDIVMTDLKQFDFIC